MFHNICSSFNFKIHFYVNLTLTLQGKSAIQSVANPLFLSLKPDKEGYIYVASRKAETDEMVNVGISYLFVARN